MAVAAIVVLALSTAVAALAYSGLTSKKSKVTSRAALIKSIDDDCIRGK